MAAKGTVAKEKFAKKLEEFFGADYIGCIDKKYYIWSEENGEKVQLCLAITCPKTPVGEVPQNVSMALNFDDFDAAPPVSKPVEITSSERENIENLMARLGL